MAAIIETKLKEEEVALSLDGDDSSDEEEVTEALERFGLDKIKFRDLIPRTRIHPLPAAAPTIIDDNFSKIVYLLGLKLYWCPQVNEIYYKEKAELLGRNKFSMPSAIVDCIKEALYRTVMKFLDEVGEVKQWKIGQAVSEKKSDQLQHKEDEEGNILLHIRDKIEGNPDFMEMQDNVIRFFKINIRLLLKITSSPTPKVSSEKIYIPINIIYILLDQLSGFKFTTQGDECSRIYFDRIRQEFIQQIKKARSPIKEQDKQVRTLLPSVFSFCNRGPLDVLIFARLINRSQNRAARQKKLLSSSLSEKTVRAFEFPNIEKTALAIQGITVSGNARVDKDINHTTYKKLKVEMETFRSHLNLSNKDVAILIRGILNNAEPPHPQFKNFAQNRESSEFLSFLANLAQLMFVTEPIRNPSCWITHHMLLDLIELEGEKLSWTDVFTLSKSKNEIKPSMPMAPKDSVPRARALSEAFVNEMPLCYRYIGPSKTKEKHEIISSEKLLITYWFDNYLNRMPRGPNAALRLVAGQVERWYGVKMEPPNQSSRESLEAVTQNYNYLRKTKREFSTPPLTTPSASAGAALNTS
jgi:hypothetical protein